MTPDQLEEALDRLADLGLSGLMTRVVEPVFTSVLTLNEEDFKSSLQTGDLLSDYWSLSKALAVSLDTPELAERAAALFFSRASISCGSWAETESIEGRPRLKLTHLKSLMDAATAVPDANDGLYGAELVAAAKARGSQHEKVKEGEIDLEESAKSPFAKLVKDLDKGFLWATYDPLVPVWDQFIQLAESKGEVSSQEWADYIQTVVKAAEKEDNAVISCSYLARAMSFAVRQPQGLKLSEASLFEMYQELKDAYADGRDQHKAFSKNGGSGLTEANKTLLSRFGQMSGSIAERLKDDFLLGAFQRSQEGPEGEVVSLALIKMCKKMFIEEVDSFMKQGAENLKNGAQASANLLDLSGGVAALNVDSAIELYDGLSNRQPGLPKEWGPWMNPETLTWLQEKTLLRQERSDLEVDGLSFAKLLARLKVTDVSLVKQKQLAKWIDDAPMVLSQSDDSKKAAEMAQTMATSQKTNPLALSLSRKLTHFGFPAPDLLQGFQDLLGVLKAFGARESAVRKVDEAMAPALAAMEAEQLQAILGMDLEATSVPKRKNRL